MPPPGGLLYGRWIDVARSHKGTLRLYIYKPRKIGDLDDDESLLFVFFLSLFYFVYSCFTVYRFTFELFALV